uniref:Uncharacterized protein n=1 Tax=Glossina pallidipes TaxID=7398 RepID=A0A1A9Z8W7_GLOPL
MQHLLSRDPEEKSALIKIEQVFQSLANVFIKKFNCHPLMKILFTFQMKKKRGPSTTYAPLAICGQQQHRSHSIVRSSTVEQPTSVSVNGLQKGFSSSSHQQHHYHHNDDNY